MSNNKLGVMSIGIKAPMIKNGDNIRDIVFESVMNSGVKLDDKDVIGITESVVARANGNYVTIDQIVEDIDKKIGNKSIALWSPIMSRNRFSLILRAFARYADKLVIFINDEFDEQGNPTVGTNPFTGVNIQDYYGDICKEENCELMFKSTSIYMHGYDPHEYGYTVVDARCHPDGGFKYDLSNFCNQKTKKHGWSEYGLLGSNKSGDETLKLFPQLEECDNLVNDLQYLFKGKTGKDVEVMIFADGCFKDPVGGIWEFADPITSPGYTDGLKGTPNEIKLKYLLDTVGEKEAMKAIKENKNKDLKGNMVSQGTTPRRYVDLLASLMDLTTGSGERCTPIVLIKNYF